MMLIHNERINPSDFAFVQQLIYECSGIVIGDHKKEMICRRLNRRMRDLGLSTLADYCNLLRQGHHSTEMVNFTNAVTTNLTAFFRENHHFDYLRDTFFPEFLASGRNRLRIWSSASSTGEEAYSIAITLLECLGSAIHHIDAKILATDLDTQVLQTSKMGLYDADKVHKLPNKTIKQWFHPLAQKNNTFSIDQALKAYITFNRLNLLDTWPMTGKFDVIFCRNVLIYFDQSVQKEIVDRFQEILLPNGLLMLGHSESILKNSTAFVHLGKTIYQKK